jgi:DNA-binding transcriptional LysR family regulator
MNGEQLRYFALAYRLESFSAAAKRIPMSPQGLTKAVRSLETELGVPLFLTAASGKLEPTPYAAELMDFVNDYRIRFAQLTNSFEAIRKHESHEVNVGIGLGILGYLGPGFIKRFNEQHPEITLRYEELNDKACDEGLKRGKYDLALCVTPFDPDFLCEQLYCTNMCFWVSKSNPLSERDILTIQDFDGEGVALPGQEFKCFEYLQSRAVDAGVEFSEVFASAEIFRLFEYARMGKGLGFSAQHLVDMPLFKEDESVVGIPLEGATWGFGIACLHTNSLNDDAQAFFDYCVENVPKRSQE